LYLPSFAAEQPGETYYYSPMNVYCFGMVEAAKDELTAMCYLEEEGKKGSNNVASMLWHYLIQQKQLGLEGVVKEINLVFDNCVGQKKNNMVLRMLFLLVKKRSVSGQQQSFLSEATPRMMQTGPTTCSSSSTESRTSSILKIFGVL
jgi:hypothetical protein